MSKYIWYAGYGSNLDEDRFLCYLEGGTPFFSLLSTEKRFEERKLRGLIENKKYEIPHRLYFAEGKTKNWGKGGIAFIDPKASNQSLTHCRIWKITEKQFECVQSQEGSLYTEPIEFELKIDNLPVLTFTHPEVRSNLLAPSDSYLKTIARGLRETYSFDDTAFVNYMKDKGGIAEAIQEKKLDEQQLRRIFISSKDL